MRRHLLALLLLATPALADDAALARAREVDARVYHWPEDAAPVRLTVRSSMVDGVLAQLASGGIPGLAPDQAAAIGEVLRRPYVVTWDLRAGTLVTPPFDPGGVTDPVRAEGLRKMHDGLAVTLGGLVKMLAEHRTAVLPVDPAMTFAEEDGAWVFRAEGQVLRFDAGTRLLRRVDTPLAGQVLGLEFLGWQDVGHRRHVPTVLAMAPAEAPTSRSDFVFTWAEHEGVWLPRTAAITMPVGVVTLTLEPAR